LPTIYCSIVELSLQDSLYILFREIQSGRSVVMPQLYKSDLQIYIPIYGKGCYRNHSVSKSLHSHAQLCTVLVVVITMLPGSKQKGLASGYCLCPCQPPCPICKKGQKTYKSVDKSTKKTRKGQEGNLIYKLGI